MELYLILLLSFTAVFFPSTMSSKNTKYDACSEKISCGNLGSKIGYPFYDGSTRPNYCGDLKLSCLDVPQITISNQSYYVSSIDVNNAYTYANKINVYREDKWAGSCPDSLANTTIDFSKYSFTPIYQNITFFYDCAQIAGLSSLSLTVSCDIDLGGNGVKSGYYLTQKMVEDNKDLNCKSHIYIPILQSMAEAIDTTPSLRALILAFQAGFELDLVGYSEDKCNSCIGSGGECGYNPGSNKFVCHCEDADYDIRCGVNSSTIPKFRGN